MTAPLPPPPHVIVCDFDGTISVEDVTNLIWDAHLPYDWRVVLRDGSVSALELMARGYGDVAATPEVLLDEVRPRVRLRPGWQALVALCQARGWPLEVVSHGLGFYIRDILPPGVSLTAFEGTFQADGAGGRGRWQVALPAGIALAAGEDFKSHVVAELRRRFPGHSVLYIGDGRLDFPAARRTELVFAVRGTPLAELCAAAAVACVPFDTFYELATALGG